MHAAAQHLQAQGRGNDSMLVHMTPGEVGGLQALARATGGSLTVNPQTGLVEAGWLESLLPTILGIAGSFIGIPPMVTAAVVGGITGIAKKDLGAGLMAGLGAYGGTGLGGALGAGKLGASMANVTGSGGLLSGSSSMSNLFGTAMGTPLAAAGAAVPAAAGAAVPGAAGSLAGEAAYRIATPTGIQSLNYPLAGGSAPAAPASGGFLSNLFGPSAEAGKGILGTNITGSQAATGLGIGLPLLSAMEPKQKAMPEEPDKYPYKGPYTPAPRKVRFPKDRDPNDSSEFQYFDVVNPVPNVKPYDPKEDKIETLPYPSMAAGGVSLKDGSFVVDARTVSELGNGSSGAGQDLLARFGGKSIKGPGDGASDSIRANIGGRQEARVARDEVKFDPKAVQRLGKGNPKKGSDRLYALMAKAHDARQSAKRGQDTGLKALLGGR